MPRRRRGCRVHRAIRAIVAAGGPAARPIHPAVWFPWPDWGADCPDFGPYAQPATGERTRTRELSAGLWPVTTLPAFSRWRQLWRYYQAGIINTLFGYGLYAGMVAVGLNIYVAQAIGHVLGVAFNWFTYSRHAFRDTQGSAGRFVLSYGVNYILSVATLRVISSVVSNPYGAGLLTVGIVSVINYFVLARFVFRKGADS
ncbi:hypothetical protein CAP39_06985 [Sphingomonas sp. IBVSS1]|nr:hypothetical protein CAP39_06985 [Sphingomonas sp. IBVSS1]